MATLELEPYFVKAIRLLHSKSKDSSDQLKAMLDDSLALRYSGSIKDVKSISIKQESENRIKKASPKNEISNKNFFEEIRKKDPDKRPLEKIKLDPGLLSDVGSSVSSKRSRLESPSSSSSSSPRSVKQEETIIKPEDSDMVDLAGEEHNVDDVALEMGLACAVCKQLDVSPGNQMIECVECHKLYHQECHQPPATDQDLQDPRTVWYCSRCHKNLKRMATKNQKVKTTIAPLNTLSKDPPTLLRTAPKTEQATPLPFKRTEIKVPSSQGSSPNTSSSTSSSLAPNKPVGLAGLAANLSSSSRASQQTQPQSAKAKLPTFSAFPSLKAGLEAAAAANSTTSTVAGKTSSTSFGAGGLASLASAAAAVSKSTLPRSLSGGPSVISPIISSSSSSSSSGNGSKLSSSTSSMMSADKRLQIMKKKAAAKMQEKRRLPK